MTLSKLAVRRLTKLADYMDTLPPEAEKHFDMGVFYSHKGEHEIKDSVAALKRFDCGTVACALGWACTIPAFKKAGLHIDESGDVMSKDGTGDEFFADGDRWEACTIYMGVFSGAFRHKIHTPQQWAAHCRKFIKANAA